MLVASKQGDVRIFSSNPSFNYFFQEANVPIEVEEAHVEKILRNLDFYLTKGKVHSKKQNDTWKKELEAIKGIGKKTSEDLIRIYPNKEMLIEDIKAKKNIPVDDDISEKLKKEFSVN